MFEGGNAALIWEGGKLVFQVGSAAWTAYQAYKLSKALATDAALLAQLSKGEYWDATKQAFIHFPYASNIKDGYLALDKGDYEGFAHQAKDPIVGIVLAYAGGKAIEQGGKLLIKIGPKAINQLRKFQQGKGKYFNQHYGAGAKARKVGAKGVEKGVTKQIGEKVGNKGVESKISSSARVGLAREQKVAELTGGRLAKDAKGQDIKVVVDNVASTGIDVIGKNGEYITVGGPAKIKNLNRWADKLHALKKSAIKDGVESKAYLVESTPDGVVNMAKKILGQDNVILFKE